MRSTHSSKQTKTTSGRTRRADESFGRRLSYCLNEHWKVSVSGMGRRRQVAPGALRTHRCGARRGELRVQHEQQTVTVDGHLDDEATFISVDELVLGRSYAIDVTLCDEHGNLAPGCPCWQFNFRFDLSEDIYAEDSIRLLQRSGIDFDAHAKRGIAPSRFAELLTSVALARYPSAKTH